MPGKCMEPEDSGAMAVGSCVARTAILEKKASHTRCPEARFVPGARAHRPGNLCPRSTRIG